MHYNGKIAIAITQLKLSSMFYILAVIGLVMNN